MNRDTFRRAKARLERAWNEAAYRYNRRGEADLNTLVGTAGQLFDAKIEMADVFGKVENIACEDCKRCCSNGAFSSGFHTHAEREALLALEENGHAFGLPMPLDYIVNDWGGEEEPPERCLFLAKDGCNLPLSQKSTQCTNYVCLDRLAPQLASQGLEAGYKKARTKNGRALRVIQDNLSDLSFELRVEDLGQG
jgi:hypothetical protein